MLDPEYLWYVSEPIVDIWEELNMWAIRDIAERIMSAELYDYDKLPGTARWRAWLLNQSGRHYEELQKKLSDITDKSENELRRLFVEAGLQTLESDAGVFNKHDIEVPALTKDKRLTQILDSAYQQTNGELKNFTRTTADASNKLFIETADKAYFDVAMGEKSATESIKAAIDTVSKNGIYVSYPSGHKDTVETAVRRAVQTGINQGASKVSLENCKKLGAEYVVITAHMGARVSDDNPIANHMGWQGKVYKIEGSTDKYGNLELCTGFPKNPLGLCGYNCRHNFYPYFLGDENPYEDIAQKIDENREIYELNQKQRYMERNIRAAKRKLQGLSAAIDNCKDDKTKFELQEEYNKTAEALIDKNKAYNTFCKDHADKGIRKKSDRVTIAGWSKEDATRAVKTGIKDTKRINENISIAKTNERDKIISGAISGARNPFGEKAREHAKTYYGLVRSMTTDVRKISKVTGISEKEIQEVKNFIFLEKHDLGGIVEYFEPDYMMAESWQRLMEGRPEKHDITLLKHELMEKQLMQSGLSQEEAHKRTSEIYNYSREAGEYYAKIKKYKKE